MKKKLLSGIIAGAALLTLAACGNSDTATNNTDSSALSGKVIAGGSTALQPMAQQASTDYTAKNPEVQITVQGGGSGVGLTQVLAGTFQIGNSDIFAEEKSGIDASKLNDYKVAVVGFAPIVNKDINIESLSTKQLIDVFTGKVKNWKEVGGPDEKITVIGRAAGSGTRVNFNNLALGGATEVDGPTQDASGTAVTMVGQTPGAISYVAFSYLDKSKDIKAVSIDNVKPTVENVADNSYKVWSYEHMYTNKEKETAVEKDFIKYVTEDIETIKKLGYIPISEMKVERDAQGKIINK
ncbi:phosphate ABC transporter substrate-binding protein [Lactococcus ileimucosae]|uniref:phosphate ABC transporter substrate-binding protein n=1 Tax=Lactococcus ileimucosae TaxID=2941329 RepID=UPI003518BA5A